MRNSFEDFLKRVNQLKIGIVYSFERFLHPNLSWYDKWHTDVISSYGEAIEFLGSIPYYIDVQSFCHQAFSKQLPKLDCIFNLNAGIMPISNWGLVPSVAIWNNIPVLPCDSETILIGENKKLSSLIAEQEGWLVPKRYMNDFHKLAPDQKIIVKPNTLGGSVGIRLIETTELTIDENNIYEEFIPGYDITVPVLFDPVNNQLACTDAIIYISKDNDTNWFHGEDSKRNFSGYQKLNIQLSYSIQQKILKLANCFGIDTLCRFDLRLNSDIKLDKIPSILDEDSKLYFLEINPMPTLRKNINFIQGIDGINLRHALSESKTIFMRHFSSENDISNLAYVVAVSLFRKL